MSEVPNEKLNRITGKNHQGVIAYTAIIEYAEVENIIDDCYNSGKNPFILILDRITDVRNFGAIIRTAECLGVHAILIPSKGGAIINADTEKTSAGALNYMPICRVKYLDKSIEYLKNSGLKVVGCTEKADKEIGDVDMSGPVAIVLGSEEDGISDKYLGMCNDLGKIPMKGKVKSLNVSVASGLVLYQAMIANG